MGVERSSYVALCGGVGGAKLALGLAELLGDRLTIIVNTGDDFEHLGLAISPDIDTVIYTLAGLANLESGWGRAGETWSFMEALAALGGPTWFKLGDKDLAMHVERSRWLAEGKALSAFCEHIRRRLGIAPAILPMSDDAVRTRVTTPDGELAFQDYFVARKCEPPVTSIRYEGAEAARPLGAALNALRASQLAGVIICPSNPYLSVDPILSLPALRQAVGDCAAPVVAVTPLIGGKAVKGPTAKLMRELGAEILPRAVAGHYGALIDGFILDEADRAEANGIPVPVGVEQTLMTDLASKTTLAQAAIDLCEALSAGPKARLARA
ncbi:MAG: 2-phospho-L-lactate transferase [Rhodomicrobiaceae bacterium]